MPSYSKITLIGHLGRDPETKYVPSGDAVTEFSVAVSERTKQGETTTWYRVSAWGRLAEVCSQYLHKGSLVYVEGPLVAREYTDREGKARTSLDVRAREVKMLDRAGDREQAGPAAGSGDVDMDHVPF